MASSHHDAIVHCPECEPYPALRNHWFLGKLVTPRDLTDEHRYVAQKIRLHHQRLHGTGIVCGLEVREHDNQRCQDRLVYLTPGARSTAAATTSWFSSATSSTSRASRPSSSS